MNKLRMWMQAATVAERQELADLADTSVGTLNQIAGGYRTNGEAVVRSGVARKIEEAANSIGKRNPALPKLFRTDLSPECRGCDFARRCLGEKAAMSGFNVVQ